MAALILAVFLLVSCGAATGYIVSPAPLVPVTAQPDEPSGSEPTAAPSYPLYFPMPYYSTFFDSPLVDNIDAFLHDTAVNYYTAQVDARSGSLLLVSLRLLDEWDAGDGGTYYLCYMATYDYYDLARQLVEKGGSSNITYGDGIDGSSLGWLVRFKVTPLGSGGNAINYWGFKAVEILEQPPWGTNGDDIRELCSGQPIFEALMDVYTGASDPADVPYLRDILPSEYAHDPPAMLEKYLETYFPEYSE